MSRFDPVRPDAGAAFYKAHGLGNDYLVVEEGPAWTLDERAVRRVCHRQEGVGGDGIVVLLLPAEEPFRLRMFNPDGSEFERSGNGLRVLASWLHRTGRVQDGRPFRVEVGGDRIAMTVHGRTDGGVYDVSVEMGRARTGPEAVALDPGALEPDAPEGERSTPEDRPRSHGRLALPGDADVAAGSVPVHLVGVGNPHCVVFTDRLSARASSGPGPTREVLDRLGPVLTDHPAFARGTNVQLARVAEGEGAVVDALIWERGVGHTTASGTSSCAVAVAAVESGRLEPGTVEVRMEGGSLFVDVSPGLDVVLRGPVAEVMTGEMEAGFVAGLAARP